MRLIIGISGASGVVMGYCLLKALGGAGVETHLVVTEAAARSRMGVLRYREEGVPHYVAYFRASGAFRFLNVCDGGEDFTEPMADFARKHLKGGSVKLIYWE